MTKERKQTTMHAHFGRKPLCWSGAMGWRRLVPVFAGALLIVVLLCGAEEPGSWGEYAINNSITPHANRTILTRITVESGNGSRAAEAGPKPRNRRRHPSAFREVYPPRIVNNIYLDSPARNDYHDHINGVAYRSKTRVRWYGQESQVAEQPALERKLKRGMVSGKEVYALPRLAINGGGLGLSLNTTFRTATFPPIVRLALCHLEPALFNRYQRRYFLSGDGKFRLTQDSGLQFAGLPPNRRPAIDPLPAASTVIVELKFRLEFAQDAARVTNAFPFRVARCSKYVGGMGQLFAL